MHQEMWEAYYFYNASKLLSVDEENILLKSLQVQEKIYPFNRVYYKSVWDLYSNYTGKGIVMTSGNWYTKYVIHSIRVLRNLNCTLPIQLFFNGVDDLSVENQQLLRKEGVTLIDASKLLSPEKTNSLQSWAIKPFAMVMSTFQEFIFLDADVLFFQNPEIMFEFKSYLETGTLYYRDRTIRSSSKPTLDFFRDMVPYPSRFARNGRIWRDTSLHEGESGVIVMDKKKGGMFVLLLASLLNMDPVKTVMYKVIFGDKESYWMASEALEVPYRWALGAGGTVGYPNPNTTGSICGGLFHVDENWEPLWFNGGIQMNKHTDVGRMNTFNLTHFAVDRTFKGVQWEWEEENHPFCLTPEIPKRDVGELSPHFKKVGQTIIDEWTEMHQYG